MKIQTKAEFYKLWHAGLLGNKPRIWRDRHELLRSGYRGELTIRSVAGVGGATKYRVPYDEAVRLSFVWPCAHNFNESMPDEHLTIQGELKRGEFGLDFNFCTIPNLKFNEARSRFTHADSGLRAKGILQYYLWPASYDDLMELLDLYPDHVVEFSAYSREVGDCPHRNAVIWEVRER